MKRSIFWWLLACEILIFGIVLIGGVTRLTHSGLSMVEWKPLMGWIPPLNHEQWLALFEKYQQYPEYILRNPGMDISGFQKIFFWEYFHRVFARLIGLVILVPYLYFLVRKKLDKSGILKGAAMVALILVQGLAGWLMVASGLSDDPNVSHFRLAIHLVLAFFLFEFILWWILDLGPSQPPKGGGVSWLITALISIQIIWGAFTAGLHAGFINTTFPLMGGQWVPSDLWVDFFSNPASVQFVHRWLGIGIGLAVLAYWFFTPRNIRKHVVLGAVVVQVILGLGTLMMKVPIHLALAHQIGALFLLSASVWVNHDGHEA